MQIIKKLIICSLIILSSCSDNIKDASSIIEGDDLETQMIKSYNEGLKALEMNDVFYAAKKFNEAELLYPQSPWASKAALMTAYAWWKQGYYSNSIDELKRFIKLYSKHKNLDYAYYLLAINYYDSIINEKKDLKPLIEAKKNFETVISKFPNTDYSSDAKYKLELIHDNLAAKEMYIARHYIKKQKWIAAINRLQNILKNYETTIYVEEALHRLVEINYIIGLEFEAKKYAKTLGYNYKSSEWYKESYRVFNKDYASTKKNVKKNKRKKLIEKINSFF
jgi:outer membrane protein assembly factor BamD